MSPDPNEGVRVSRRAHRLLGPVAVAVGLALLAAACGDDTTATDSAVTATTSGTTAEATSSADGAVVEGGEENEAVDNETAEAEVLAATACEALGDAVGTAVDVDKGSDDLTTQAGALADVGQAVSTAIGDPESVILPGPAEAALAVENITARADELGLRGCMIESAPPAS